MTEKQAKLLAYPFTADEIEWRVLLTTKDKSKGQVAAYIDSRAIQKRLDDVLGRENWKNHFITMPGNSNSTTAHICEISIYYPDRQEWITKSDGAGSTDIEPIKGGLSNAFKRAASIWNIGRYLYELPGLWVALKDGKYIDPRHPDADLSILEGTVHYPVFAVAVQADGFDNVADAITAAFGAQYNPWGTPATNWQ